MSLENNELDDLHSDDNDTTEVYSSDPPSVKPTIPKDEHGDDIPINVISQEQYIVNKGIRDQQGISITDSDRERDPKWEKYRR
jgi:hypothetical protein